MFSTAIHFLDVGRIYIVEAGGPETRRAEISIVARIEEVTPKVSRKWNR